MEGENRPYVCTGHLEAIWIEHNVQPRLQVQNNVIDDKSPGVDLVFPPMGVGVPTSTTGAFRQTCVKTKELSPVERGRAGDDP